MSEELTSLLITKIFIKTNFFRPSPTRLNSTTLPRNYLGSDQLYPDDFAYPNQGAGGGYFNPLEAMTSSPLRSR